MIKYSNKHIQANRDYYYTLWAQNLKQGILMKTSFKTRVSRIGLGSFVDINIFCCEISFYLFSPYSPLFKSFKSKSTIMLRPHKGNSRVSFNDTLLNFGLWWRDCTSVHLVKGLYKCTLGRGTVQVYTC